MKKGLLSFLIVSVIILLFGSVHFSHAAYYETIWSWPSGPTPTGEVNLNFTGWDPDYIETAGYRVAKLTFEINNPSSRSYYDVKMVLPFVWENFNPAANPAKQASSWDNVNQEWINDHVSYGNVDGNGLYVKVYSGPDSPTFSYLTMSQTDIPLTAKYDANYELATVASTDSVLAWLVDSVLTPGESVTFSTYLEYERRSTETPYLTSLWVDPYVVATPIPSAVWLLGSGLIGIVGIRRKYRN